MLNLHPTHPPEAIFVEGLTIGYGSVRVMAGLNMKVPAGSIYGLLGPSMAFLVFLHFFFVSSLLILLSLRVISIRTTNELCLGGCGKSTLLKVLLGRLFPEAGVVRVLGKAPGVIFIFYIHFFIY